MSPFTLALFGSSIVTNVEEAAVVIGLFFKISKVGNSVLAGLAFVKPCGSAEKGFGSNCGCFFSNSDV